MKFFPLQLVMACGMCCRRRRDGDSEHDKPAKPQGVPTKSQGLSLLKRRPKSSQTSPQPPPPTATQSPPPNAQPSPPSSPISTTTDNNPTLVNVPSMPSGTAVRGGFHARLPKWLKFPKPSPEQRQGTAPKTENQVPPTGVQAPEPKSSSVGVSSAPQASASDGSTERLLDPQQSSSPAPTSAPHTTDHIEASSPTATAQQITTSTMDMVVEDHSSGSRHEAAPSAPWIVSKDNLKRMEANQFQFNLIPLPTFYAKVDHPDGFPAKVTTLSAPSYLMSTFPPYAVQYHHPNRAQKKKIIYYELQDIPDDWGTDGNIWFGFSKLSAKGPPGSGPGSIGINRSDGGLYYNGVRVGNHHNLDFDCGAKIGIGLVFSYGGQISDSNSDSAIEVRVIHTRQGELVDNELVDTLIVDGRDCFDGNDDLFATVGTVDRVAFEVLFEEKDWSFKPKEHGV